MSYNPVPSRVWSRVQNSCVYITPGLPDQYNVYIPLTGKTVSQAQANYESKQIYKGNILQYKGNSARLTKSQKYSQLARGGGPNRRKVYATQSQTYTNPNTSGLMRSGFQTYNYPNQIVGAPNNISGPFQYNVSNPNDCSSNTVQDGGILVCGTYVNPCTGTIYITSDTNSTICNPSSASNVPGSEVLCWNKKVQTWFPRQRYIMNNSTDKWPTNYKGFVSAIKLKPPIVSVINLEDTIEVIWTSQTNECYPISNYNIYINGQLYKTTDYNVNKLIINKSELSEDNSIMVESVSGHYIQTGKTTVSYIKTDIIDDVGCSCSFFNTIMNNTSVTSINTLLLDCNQNLLNLDMSDNILNLNEYNNIKIELETFKRTLDNDCCLIQIIDLYQEILTNLYQSLNIKSQLIDTINTSAEYKNAYDILHDSTKLQEYINNLSKNMYLASVTLTSAYAKLQPKYNIYIQLYGIPDNLNFDPSQLTSIVNAIETYNLFYGTPVDSNYELDKINSILTDI